MRRRALGSWDGYNNCRIQAERLLRLAFEKVESRGVHIADCSGVFSFGTVAIVYCVGHLKL